MLKKPSKTTDNKTLKIFCLSHLFLTKSSWNNFCRCDETSWRLGFHAPPSLQHQVSSHQWCHASCEPRALSTLRGGCSGNPPLPLPWEQWENSMAATAHCLGAPLLQELSLLGCVALHGWLLKVRVVLHVWKMQLRFWSRGKHSWESVPLLVTEGASLPGVNNSHLVVKSTIGSPFCLNPKPLRVFLAVKPGCVLARERKKHDVGTRGNKTT